MMPSEMDTTHARIQILQLVRQLVDHLAPGILRLAQLCHQVVGAVALLLNKLHDLHECFQSCPVPDLDPP